MITLHGTENDSFDQLEWIDFESQYIDESGDFLP